MKKLFAITLSIFTLTGCATSYQSDGLAGGFSEVQLGENLWRVSFRGNGYTESTRAEDFAMLRSADLTLIHGFTHFVFVDGRLEKDFTAVSDYKGRISTFNSPSAVNTVMMFKEKPGPSLTAFDAKFICRSVGAKYKVACGP